MGLHLVPRLEDVLDDPEPLPVLHLDHLQLGCRRRCRRTAARRRRCGPRLESRSPSCRQSRRFVATSLGLVSTPSGRGEHHEAAVGTRCVVPLHGDAIAVRPRVEPLDLRAPGRSGLRAARARGGRRSSAGCTCSSRCGGGCATCPFKPRPPVLDRRPRLRPRLPRAPHRRARRRAPTSSSAELVARIIGRPLDRSRPLWETYVIEGLPDDRFGILTKVHHATIDGASGAELLTLMLDQTPEGDDVPPPERGVEPRARCRPTPRCWRGPAPASSASPAGRSCSAARTVRELGKATRNPALVAAANQMRGGLRGPLGALLNIGRERTPRARPPGPLPVVVRAAHAVQRADHRRTAASPSGRRRSRR